MNLKSVLISFLFVCQFVLVTEAANILFYFVISGYSHMNSVWPLIDRLLENGHNITLISSVEPHQPASQNLTILVSKDSHAVYNDVWDEDADLIKERQAGRQFKVLDPFFDISYKTCEAIVRSPFTHDLIHNSHFDLVVIDEDGNSCAMALAFYKYKAPFMFYSAFTFFGFMYDEYGVPLDTSSIPDTEYGRDMTFVERLRSTLLTSYWTYMFHTRTYEPMGRLMQETFALEETPSISDLYGHTSLVLINNHPSTDYPRSLPPLFVPVAGMHIETHQLRARKPLPKEVERFISRSSSDGFIYVSFGTSIRISKSNHEIREKLFSAMGNTTRIQFLWKWEGDELPENAPANIYFANWLPQQDLYGHSRIRGAITHCGLNGMHEAVYYGVPLILFPICYDQNFNAHSVASKGMGIQMEIATFTQEELQDALKEILTNTTIKANIASVSKLFKDRPMTATDTALWWVEHVLRTKGKTGLVSPGKWQTWYQRRLLDVWLLIFVAILTCLSIVLLAAYKIFQFVCKSSSSKASRTSRDAKKRN